MSNEAEDEAIEIARRNALAWVHHVRRVYIPYLDTFSEVLLRWLAPSLSEDKIAKAADDVESKTFDNFGWNEDTDPSQAAQYAFDAGLEYYTTVRDVAWAVLSMAAAALYHLVEQQLCELCRLAFFGPQGDPVSPGKGIALLKKIGVDVETFNTWQRLDELRHLANCVKHAEGNSCSQLRQLRPELFEKPTVGPRLKIRVRHVRNPLMGEDIYLTEEALSAYLDAVREFWLQLADRLERSQS